ncbi:hypothetical protein FVE85_3773 [Porphyridium purpureum]|uniref:Uncharacterized protein n=1 Tax=Porphyridium purpureum TaxID=35688 RepID=A0A5J4YMF8_PORPP|nr:hypothetical protein FVE85_3773 [Porphyridium purpureum]|eukprot:POR9815..scf249_10
MNGTRDVYLHVIEATIEASRKEFEASGADRNLLSIVEPHGDLYATWVRRLAASDFDGNLAPAQAAPARVGVQGPAHGTPAAKGPASSVAGSATHAQPAKRLKQEPPLYSNPSLNPSFAEPLPGIASLDAGEHVPLQPRGFAPLSEGPLPSIGDFVSKDPALGGGSGTGAGH